jgi:hypothetical protein
MLWLALLASCRRDECEIQPILQTLAGPQATDCGDLDVDESAKGWACVARALDAGGAFYFDTYDFDVDVASYTGVASDGTSVWEAWQTDEAITRPDSIDGRDCFDPVVKDATVEMDEKGTEATQVECTGGVGETYEICGRCNGCGPELLTDG